MKAATWSELLVELIAATRARRIRWRSTDAQGSFVAAFGGRSILIRGLPSGAGIGPTIVASAIGGLSVEIRGGTGNMLAAVGSGLSVAGQFPILSGDPDDQIVTQATRQLKNLVADLANEVRKTQSAGERGRGILSMSFAVSEMRTTSCTQGSELETL